MQRSGAGPMSERVFGVPWVFVRPVHLRFSKLYVQATLFVGAERIFRVLSGESCANLRSYAFPCDLGSMSRVQKILATEPQCGLVSVGCAEKLRASWGWQLSFRHSEVAPMAIRRQEDSTHRSRVPPVAQPIGAAREQVRTAIVAFSSACRTQTHNSYRGTSDGT
jgi:hypothetical protein